MKNKETPSVFREKYLETSLISDFNINQLSYLVFSCRSYAVALQLDTEKLCQGPLLLTWFNFNLNMDKYLHAL